MPTSFEIRGAVKVRALMDLYLPRAIESRLGFKLFPLVETNEHALVLERNGIRRGLQHARGEDGPTGPARPPGFESFRVDPGFYGDHYTLREGDMVRTRALGDWQNFEEEPELTMKAQEFLAERFRDRAEKNIWDLCQTGKFEASNVQGVVIHRDMYSIDTANTPGTLFSTLTTSTPLKYLRELIPGKERGKSVRFSKGRMVMNRTTFNTIFANTNAADLGGRLVENGGTVNKKESVDEILIGQGLPPVEIYDEGYYPDGSGSFTTFLTDGKIVLFGVREDNEPVGEYRLTRAAQNEKSKPGMWVQVKDRRDEDPPNVIVRAGHNGGPVAEYPEGIVVVNAF